MTGAATTATEPLPQIPRVPPGVKFWWVPRELELFVAKWLISLLILVFAVV